MGSEEEFYKVTTAPKDSRFYVNSKYESLDYDHLDCQVFIDEEEARGKIYMLKIIIKRVLVFFTIGLLVGTVGAIIEVGVYYGSFMRYSLLYNATHIYLDKSFLKLCYLWILSLFAPAFIAAVLVAYGEPLAMGGGAQFALSYLNGVNLRSLMKYKVVLIKSISLILTVMSGLPTGKEGPFVFMGCIIGGITPFMSIGKYHPFSYFQHDTERRDMGTAGTAAGFTAAFGTPIAGVMIAFEENLTLWSGELTFLIFISALISWFALKLLLNGVLLDCFECVASKENLFLESMKMADKSYLLFELPLYIIFGVMGGLFGGIWNLLQDKLFFFRRRFVDTPAKRLIEVIVVLILNGIFQIFCVKYLEDYCIQDDGTKNMTESIDNPTVIKLKCKKADEYSASGLFFFQNTGGVFRSLFTANESHIGTLPLAIFGLYYYIGTCLLTGCQLCHGIFVPHILVGNIWGRMIAEILNRSFPKTIPWARPNKFALLCGAAQICGTLRTTFTICVMMLESCNNVTLGIPIFIVVFTARLIGNCMNLPMLLRASIYLGIPLLEREPPPLLTHIKVKDIISYKPVVTLPMVTSYRLIREVLSSNSHNGFPVVNSGYNPRKDIADSYGVLKGLILRTKVKVLLKYRHIFSNDQISHNKKMNLLHRELTDELMDEPLTWNEEEDDDLIDLSLYMNLTPHFVQLDCSLSHAYRTFVALGLRHLVVVNNRYQVVGMITRKDLSVFRFIRSGPYLDIIKLPIRDK